MHTPKMSDTRQRKRRKKGSLAALRGVVWSAIESAELNLGSSDPDVRLKAAHAISSLAGTYTKVHAAVEAEDYARRHTDSSLEKLLESLN